MLRRAFAIALIGIALLVSACAGSPTPGGSQTAAIDPSLVRTGAGWSASGIEGPVPAPGSCHFRHSRGYSLPDPGCTPGAIDTAVSAATLDTTICRRGGYTASVRPPLEVTAPVKRAVLAAYGIPASDSSQYELDHLVELGAGGSSDVRNLWPEPNQDAGAFPRNQYVHNDKDEIESRTHAAICSGQMTLAQAQSVMASDWTQLMQLPPAGRG